MLAKFGLVILIIIFGACMFIAGLMAPDAQRESFDATAERMLGRVPAPAAPAAPAAAAPKAVTSAAPGAAAAPVRLDSLLVTAAVSEPVPGKGKPVYALQLGQFATVTDADAAMQRIKAAGLGMPLSQLSTLDSENEPWSVVAIGQFVSTEAAVRAAPRIQNVLDLRETPVIQLPPSAPPPSDLPPSDKSSP